MEPNEPISQRIFSFHTKSENTYFYLMGCFFDGFSGSIHLGNSEKLEHPASSSKKDACMTGAWHEMNFHHRAVLTSLYRQINLTFQISESSYPFSITALLSKQCAELHFKMKSDKFAFTDSRESDAFPINLCSQGVDGKAFSISDSLWVAGREELQRQLFRKGGPSYWENEKIHCLWELKWL